MVKITNITHGIVASRPEQHYGWPGIVRTMDGDILVGASERKHHIGPFGRIVLMRSKDDGETWEQPQEIYNSELDDRDTTLGIFSDGMIFASWFTVAGWTRPDYCREEWKSRRDRVTTKMFDELAGHWMIRSNDGGRTWENTPLRLPDGGAEHNSPFVLSDDTLVSFGYEWMEGGRDMYFYKSRDRGESWERMGIIPSGQKVELVHLTHPGKMSKMLDPRINERGFLELGANHLLALFRTASEGGYLATSRSRDGGKTWTDVVNTKVLGKPPHLLKLSSGPILCCYSHRLDPWSIRAVLSHDEGETWDAENILTLDQWNDHPDMGYPVSIETSPDRILTVYYCSRRPHHMESYESTFIQGASPEGILSVRYGLEL